MLLDQLLAIIKLEPEMRPRGLAATARQHLLNGRKQALPVMGMNPSTTSLMTRYLKGDGGYDTKWQLAPETLKHCANLPTDSVNQDGLPTVACIIGNIDVDRKGEGPSTAGGKARVETMGVSEMLPTNRPTSA